MLVERFDLRPPVDVHALAKRWADVEVAAIPGCSGLVLGLDGRRPKPLILVNSAESKERQRFTLAHELGHFLMPWHLGTDFFCDTSDRRADLRSVSAAEPEANRFAAELLAPSAWLDELIAERSDQTVASLFRQVLAGEVSSWVAAFRLSEKLPGGHVFALVDSVTTVVISGETDGPRIGAPPRGSKLNRQYLDQFASTVEEVRVGSRAMIWWTFRDQPGAIDSPAGDSRRLLGDLAERYGTAAHPPRRLKESMAGIIGYANTQARKRDEYDPSSLYAAFRSRFAKTRDLPPGFLDDPDFDTWLRLRAIELGDQS